MQTDYFASSGLSLVLSWVFSIPLFIGFIQIIIVALKKHDDLPWAFSAWVGLCFLILSPLRYEALLLTLAVSYPFQSITAFVTVIEFWCWMPAVLAFALLNAIGLLIPLFITLWIAGNGEKLNWFRCLISGIVAPVVAFGGSFLFFLALPFAGITAHLLDADAIIRATNGPAHVVFYSEGPGMVAFPPTVS
jgi:hypothetical protein